MNKIQIRAEILTLITKLQTTTSVDDEMFRTLDEEQDKQSIMEILLKELQRAKEQKAFVICYMLTRLFEKDFLVENLREFIRDRKISDSAKMIAFNILKDLGSDIQYDEVSGFFTEFDQIVEEETKEMLNSALMNPEAQIDFIDFLSALGPEDQLVLVRALNEDYTQDALANILIPIFLYNPTTAIAKEIVTILGDSKSELAFHALESSKEFVPEELLPLINKSLSTLKLSGIRTENAEKFYKSILTTSKPYRSFISYPDGHGNQAVVFTRKRENGTLQFMALVINDQYGILDCFGFHEITENDLCKILQKFYGENGGMEIAHETVKYLIDLAENMARYNKDELPYEYVCWKNIMLDVLPKKPECKLELKTLTTQDIENLCLNDLVQSWFYDEITSENFSAFIEKLNNLYKNNQYDTDLDKFIDDNFNLVFTKDEIETWENRFFLSAFLCQYENKNELATILYSLNNNKEFLTNILRKSIYEYYIGKRWQVKNGNNTTNIFQRGNEAASNEFEHLQLDMIISTIESKWVK